MFDRIKNLFLVMILLPCLQAHAINTSYICITNSKNQARITLNFINNPKYIFSQLDKYNVAIYIKQISFIQGLPLQFGDNNLVKRIYSNTLKNANMLQLVISLTKNSKTYMLKRKKNATKYTLIFVINAITSTIGKYKKIKAPCTEKSAVTTCSMEHFNHSFKKMNEYLTNSIISSDIVPRKEENKIIVVIDAGHGGRDPGAIGPNGILEKNVTIAIAKKLLMFLNNDSMFKGLMTRNGDHFISVMKRSEVARKQNADLLVSVHANAATNHNIIGSSVLVLSNLRANNELANWFEEYENQSEILGSTSNLLLSQTDPYLSQAVLDLQFDHSQRVGYDIATKVLNRLEIINSLYKRYPEYASLGVLCSPDIPSILVETGFISNIAEESLLANANYQKQIAEAIYEGLHCYFNTQRLQFSNMSTGYSNLH